MSDATEPFTEQLETAKGLMQAGRFSAALEPLNSVLSEDDENTEALYMLAVSQRHLGKLKKAEETLERLLSLSPEYGRGYQDKAHLHREKNEVNQALEAYQYACQLNPALIASWEFQAKLLEGLGRSEEARAARQQKEHFQSLPRHLLAVVNYMHEGKLLKAEKICRQFMQSNPRHVEGMRLLAEIGKRFGVMTDAEFLLQSAVEFSPDNIQARLDYIDVLRKQQKFEAAHENVYHLYQAQPENPLFQSHYALDRMQAGEYETAFELFDKVLRQNPNDPATLTSKGHALKTFGRREEAIASYQAAYRSKPDHGDAYYALANLKTYAFSEDEIKSMRQIESKPGLSHQNRIFLCFALAKALEDQEKYEDSFEFYERGNALKTRQTRYKSEIMTKELEAQSQYCDASLFEACQTKGEQAPDPIFIVGLPRAGSTLLEQILASHSQVDGTQELPNILALAHKLRGRGTSTEASLYPENLREMSADQLKSFGRNYIEDTRYHRKGAPFFIDKMPNNFRHIGLISLILPNAKIIDARRHPMACCFSGFKQLFAEGQEFTYGLKEIGTYYRDYVRLMRHWDEVLPGKVLRVHYEDVVTDTESQVRRLLEFCNLPYEEACLSFYETDRSVRTASSEQVRQPIYTSGLEQWKHFEPWLSPLKTSLGSALKEHR